MSGLVQPFFSRRIGLDDTGAPQPAHGLLGDRRTDGQRRGQADEEGPEPGTT